MALYLSCPFAISQNNRIYQVEQTSDGIWLGVGHCDYKSSPVNSGHGRLAVRPQHKYDGQQDFHCRHGHYADPSDQNFP